MLVTDGKWHHLALTLKPTFQYTAYVDGTAFTGTGSAAPNGSGATFYIGNDGGGDPLDGLAADIVVWNVSLTAGEIAGLVSGQRPYLIRPQNRVGDWPLFGDVSPEPDLSGNANNGTLTGTALAPGPPTTLFTPRRPQILISPPTQQPETNPHFIGRYNQTGFIRFNYNVWDTGVPQPETNPHWLGRFVNSVFTRFNYNTWDTGVPQPETNVHFLGRYKGDRYVILPGLRHNLPGDFIIPNEANPHFLGQFLPTRLRANALWPSDYLASNLVPVNLLELAAVLDQEFANVVQPQPGCPVIGPGPGSNIVVTGPGVCDCD